MLEINFRSILSEFNCSKFLVCSTLLLFFILLALKLDNIIVINYFFVFMPIWIGEFIVFLGFFVGFFSFIWSSSARVDVSSRNDFFAMCFSTLEHLLLLLFEFLCCFKLNNLLISENQQISWLLTFSPLFVQCFMAMIISVWCIRHDKSFEFEMFFSINVVQFVFIAFKLDRALHWNWIIVFVPIWVIFALFFIGTFYSFVISIFLSRSFHTFNTQRRSHIFSAICHFISSIPLLMFFILLSSKLDSFDYWFRHHFSTNRVPYIVISIPLFISMFFFMLLSFGNKSGNTWWFGMRKPFCNFVFKLFPCLQQYTNISYKFRYKSEASNTQNSAQNQIIDSENIQMLNTVDVQPSIIELRTNRFFQNNSSKSLIKNFLTQNQLNDKDYSIETPD